MMIEIRNIVGEMPFDRDGFHATGREVLQELPNGKHAWFAEFEDDSTVDMPITESPDDEAERWGYYDEA